ncbi:MAG: hypothetical protein ABI200_07410 [Gaiellales bacterium]
MTDATATPPSTTPDVSTEEKSRWILKGRDHTAADAEQPRPPVNADPVPAAEPASKPPRQRTFWRAVGTFLTRSIVTIVIVAALVATAAAATSLYHTRTELDTARTSLATSSTKVDELQTKLDSATAGAASKERAAAEADAQIAALESERDGLELEVKVLRGMLVDKPAVDAPAAATKRR